MPRFVGIAVVSIDSIRPAIVVHDRIVEVIDEFRAVPSKPRRIPEIQLPTRGASIRGLVHSSDNEYNLPGRV